MEKELESWKAKYLSLGERITLNKAVLSNLPIYFMFTFKCPVVAVKQIEKLLRGFLWHGSGDKKEIPPSRVVQGL